MRKITKTRSGRRMLGALGAMSTVWALAAVSAGGQTPPPERPPMAEDVFKNIQVLKGIPVDAFLGTMGFFSAATGLNCTDCHVEESGGDWARYADDNNLKRTARRMVLMMNGINRTNFGGRQVVTCNTCHRGTNRPNVMPSLASLYGAPAPDEPGEPFRQAARQPPASDVLDKYLAALGGIQRLSGMSSFVAKGTFLGFGDAEKAPIEIFANAQGQLTTVIHSRSGDNTTAYDGRAGWVAAPLIERPVPLMAVTGQELDGIKLDAQLLFPTRIKQALSNWRVGVPATIDDREVLLVQGTTASGGTATLCIDAQTGLLVRLVRFAESPVGRLVTQVDYADYRDVAGVKMPFRWTVSRLNGRSEYELTDLQPNVSIDATRFARPTRSAPPTVR